MLILKLLGHLMLSRILRISTPAFVILLSACSANGPMPGSNGINSTGVNSGVSSYEFADTAVMGKWARSCALCHVTGEAGAPVVGDDAEWQRRLAQGERVVMRHVLEGYNSMPPLGYCMACEEADFRAMIGFMARTGQ